MTIIKIGKHKIGAGEKCFIIAEIAQAHEGSLGQAFAFIDAAAAHGADAIKFQTHIAEAESTKDETFRMVMSGQDETRYNYWKRMEFTPVQWSALAARAKEKNLVFLSSPFSLQAAKLLQKIGMTAWKIGSGEFRSAELIDFMIKTKKPVLLSTGMSNNAEITETAKLFQKSKTPYALFQCTSQYPAPLDQIGLNILQEYKKYKCPVGLSDHSGTPFPSLAAIAQGANLIELHVIFDKTMYGPDTIASVTFKELKFISEFRDACHIMMKNPVDKDKIAQNMKAMRSLFTKSIAFKASHKAGTFITADMITAKKPGTGIPFTEKGKIIGRRLRNAVTTDRLLKWEDLDA